jgi:hypothetical protein
MARLVISLALIAACSGAQKAPTSTKPGDGSGAPLLAKKVAVTWGIEPQGGEMTDVFLATTDETGKQVSHPLGRYKGVCSVITPAKEMNALTGVACRTGPTGTELHAVIEHGEDIIVLKMGIDEGVRQDPMAREEVTRVKVSPGAKIQIGGG